MTDDAIVPKIPSAAARCAPVSWQKLFEAFEFASFDDGYGRHAAFICRLTGRVFSYSEDDPDLNELEEVPDDIEEETDKYIAVPNKRDLDLGKPLVLKFSRDFLSEEDYDDVRFMFSKPGAYGHFKRLLAKRNAVDRWYQFEAKETEQALRDWCEVNSIRLTD